MKKLAAAALYLWMACVLWAAFYYAPLAEGFLGQSSQILFFHVPMAWTAILAFWVSAVWSAMYLRSRNLEHDRAAATAVELGLIFGILATITGSIWARIMWGHYWNWDPRQLSIVIALLFYGAYLAFRNAIEDRSTRARLSAVYALVAAVVTPFFFFVLPRIQDSLHPEPVLNARAEVDMETRMVQVLLASLLGFTALFFWMHRLRRRVEALRER